MHQLERIHIADIKPTEFARAFRSGSGTPVLITGVLDGLDPCSLEWLQSKLPDAKLPVRYYGRDHFKKPKTEWKVYSEIRQMTPAEYAASLTDRAARDENMYMAQVPIGETELGALMRPIMNRLGANTGLEAVIDLNLWWGPGGHTEPLHYDSGDGTLLQLYGTKRALLFPPSQTRNLYPFPVRSKGIAPWISQVYVDRPDFKAFPGLREALEHKIDVTLNAGEVLFIPANWWHEVSATSDDYICSLNRFWTVRPFTRLFTNRISPIVYPLSMMALALYNRKQAKEKARAAGKGDA